jgi:hypothetical protein
MVRSDKSADANHKLSTTRLGNKLRKGESIRVDDICGTVHLYKICNCERAA